LTSPPSISVVMPAFNAEDFIGTAIKSILGQDYRDFELIVVDDGSTDKTTRIAEDFQKRDPRISVLRQKNAGQAAANNAGIGVARGEFIARMDADDVALSNRLTTQLRYLSENPDTVVVGSNMWLCDSSGRRLRKSHVPLTNAGIRRALFRYGSNPLNNPTVLFRRQSWIDVGGERPGLTLAHDLDLWLRMAGRGKMTNLPEPLLDYRVHASQASLERTRIQAITSVAAFVAAECRTHGLEEPAFVRGNANVTERELLAQGVDSNRCDEAVMTHAVCAHRRLCWSGSVVAARQLRASLRTELSASTAASRQAAALVQMLAQEAMAARRLTDRVALLSGTFFLLPPALPWLASRVAQELRQRLT